MTHTTSPSSAARDAGHSVTIEYRNGQRRAVATTDEARAILTEQYPDMVECENGWEPAGADRERLLIWATEAASEGDDGTRAVAQIIRAN